MNPTAFKSKSIQHGKIFEKQAIEEFSKHHNIESHIKKCGLFVSFERPHIGASPDCLLFDNSIIEVKCPYTNRYLEINEKTVPYLETDIDNNLQLKRNHPYFYQIQGQLYVTKRKSCILLIFTFKEIIAIQIERDEEFISTMIGKLDEFYKEFLEPAVINKYVFKNYKAIFIK